VKYSALEIQKLRGLIAYFDNEGPLQNESKLVTYMSNETTAAELAEHYKNTRCAMYDYSPWNDTGRVRKWGGASGNECIGDEPFDYADFRAWESATSYCRDDDHISYTEWKAGRRPKTRSTP